MFKLFYFLSLVLCLHGIITYEDYLYIELKKWHLVDKETKKV